MFDVCMSVALYVQPIYNSLFTLTQWYHMRSVNYIDACYTVSQALGVGSSDPDNSWSHCYQLRYSPQAACVVTRLSIVTFNSVIVTCGLSMTFKVL